ncbi:hypothetical protein Bca4012_005289 [Brassica carinata]|uniref:Transmembrane protein n=2 Tax=Brassica TaxID=3705 RepID=A0A8X7RT82_BRACI|nr:uncharacterized protein LOC106430944 [Brassica napus]KAG2293653.1 hypothetical protein Bca52824_040322 [Brassica carinata]VDC94856.1 unnamed protein product [Brassica oleracea]
MGLFSFWKLLKEVVGMLNESRKLFLKNKKLMFSVSVFYLLLNGLLYLFNVLTITPEITNLTQDLNLLPTMDPSSPEYMAQLMKVFADFRLFVVSSDIFNAVSFIINLLSVLVIVQASALTYKHENVKFKDFVVLILKSWKGPLVTSFYISLFSLGYCLFFVIILFPILLSSLSIASLFSLVAKVFVLLVLFLLFASYLAIVWYLSMVISVLEETYGIQALGEAAKIVKGMKPKLFLLNIFYGLLIFGLAQIVTLVSLVVDRSQSFVVTLAIGLVLVVSAFVGMFLLMTYTVAYFQCKSPHGQDVESLRDVEYTTLPTTSLIGALP